MGVIWVAAEAEYFCKEGWTGFYWFARRAVTHDVTDGRTSCWGTRRSP